MLGEIAIEVPGRAGSSCGAVGWSPMKWTTSKLCASSINET